MQYSEEQLIKLLRDRNQTVFSYLYANYSPALYGIIYRMVEDRETAEDILQEAFVLIWKNIGQYDASKRRFFTWVSKLAKNLTIDVLRSKNYKERSKISGNEMFAENMSDEKSAREMFDALGVRKSLLSLRGDYKVLIDMAYFYGYTQQQIADELQIPIGTVKTRLRTAIGELKQLFTDDTARVLNKS